MPAARVTLVTGFPNFRAAHLVDYLLASCGDLVWAVVAREDLAAAERHRDLLPHGERARLQLLTGDAAAIDMGLSGPEYRQLTLAVECIQHLAQTSGSSDAREPCELVNVGGMREALELARACERLQSLVVHSSVCVSGDRLGYIGESELAAGQRFSGPGPATLARAELMARRRMPQLPIVIVRSGQVLGSSEDGRIDTLEGVYLLILLMLNSPQDLAALLPQCGNAPLNVVPVDYLVRAADALSRTPDAVGQTVQLTDPNPMSVRMAFEHCTRLRVLGAKTRTGAVLRRDGLLRDSLQSIVRRPRPFVSMTFREVRYSTEIAERLLGAWGLPCPPLASYFERLVRHVAESLTKTPVMEAAT